MPSKIKYPVDTKKRREMAYKYMRNEISLYDVCRYLSINEYQGRTIATYYLCRALKEGFKVGEWKIV